MTIAELQAKRDRILKSIGISRQQSADQSIAYTENKGKELALIDAEIARLEAEAAGTTRTRQIRMTSTTGLN